MSRSQIVGHADNAKGSDRYQMPKKPLAKPMGFVELGHEMPRDELAGLQKGTTRDRINEKHVAPRALHLCKASMILCICERIEE